MEKTLQKLSDSLNNKFNQLFILKSKNSYINQRLPFPIELEHERSYVLGLVYFTVYNSIRNVTLENNKLKVFHNTTWKELSIPPGSYEVNMINDFILETAGVDANNKYNIELKPNLALNKFDLILRGGYQIDFNVDNSINKILGFEKKVYSANKQTAENRGNIENDIDTINIHCNLITGGLDVQSGMNNIIYSIPSFTVNIGYRIIEKPINVIYFPVNRNSLESIVLEIKDDEGRLIDFGDEQITIQLHLKQI